MRSTIFGIAGAMLTAFLSTLVVWFSVVGLVGQQQATQDYATQMLGNALLGVVVGIAVLLYAQYVGGIPIPSFAFRWNSRDTIYSLAMALVTLAMAAGTMLLFNRTGRHEITLVAPQASFLALGLLGQIGVLHEELLFRGYILPKVYRHAGSTWAIIISAVLFALMHIPFKGAGFMLVSWMLGGLLYGYLYLKSGSLMVTLVTHTVHNWALDLFMYSRPGISVFQFAETRLVGLEKIGFEFLLTLVLFAVIYVIYGRGMRFLAPSPRLQQHWSRRHDAMHGHLEPMSQ
jgi:membrane protease YdiL (CAAX protease family)